MPETNRKQQKKKSEDLLARVENPHAAGIDVGAEEMVVAVPQDRCAQPVRTFASFTADLHALRDWLLECGIETVALESTANYWIAIYQILEESGLKVCLINARHIKSINRKKTDVCDAQWLQQLHQAGLLRAWFRPDKEIAPLRYVMRHRAAMVAEASRQIQLMQKALTECNLKLHHVFSDLDGESCLRIIEAILAGERDPQRLAAMRDHRCRTPLPKILKALESDYRPEYLFVLGQCLNPKSDFGGDEMMQDAEPIGPEEEISVSKDTVISDEGPSRPADCIRSPRSTSVFGLNRRKQIRAAVAECDVQVEQILSRISTPVAAPEPGVLAPHRRPQKNLG